MPDFIDLRPGMRLSILSHDGALSTAFESVIRRVTDQGIRIDAPARDGELLEAAPDDVLQMVVHLRGRMYRLRSVVRLVEYQRGALVITPPEEAKAAERRQFYRLLTSLDVRYAGRLDEEGEEVQRLSARIIDISGGGLQLQSPTAVSVGARVRLVFALDDEVLETDVVVMRVSTIAPSRTHVVYRLHCRFRDLDRQQREQVIRFVFRKQIELRQRGVI